MLHQYLEPEKKKDEFSSYCSFCGSVIPYGKVKFKIHYSIGILGAYCPECWAWEFPNENNPNINTPYMKILYDNKGRRIKLDLSNDADISFNPAEFP